MSNELLQTIARVRRATRSPDIITMCDALEEHLTSPKPKRKRLTRAEIQRNYRLRKKRNANPDV